MITASTKTRNPLTMIKNVISNRSSAHFENAAVVNELSDLDAIHQEEKNIAIYKRPIHAMNDEIKHLLNLGLQLRFSGSSNEILDKLIEHFDNNSISTSLLFNDIRRLLEIFKKISAAQSFRFNLLTVNSNMCRRFHTDINDLRLLCTYSGQGTYWLPEEAANRTRHHEGGENESIVVKPKLIQQANTGDVLILKGALYPEARAIIHRSPSIEESAEKRLLLRIDTNESFNF